MVVWSGSFLLCLVFLLPVVIPLWVGGGVGACGSGGGTVGGGAAGSDGMHVGGGGGGAFIFFFSASFFSFHSVVININLSFFYRVGHKKMPVLKHS